MPEEEYVASPEYVRPDTPMRSLWRAVFTLAMRDLHTKKYGAGVRRWIASESEEEQSFEWLCSALDMEPDYIRRLVKERMINTHVKTTEKRTLSMGGREEKHDRGMPESQWSSLRGRKYAHRIED